MDEPQPAKGEAEDIEEGVYGMVSRMASSRDKLWRAMLSCSVSGWFLGEVNALDSHEQCWSDLL